MSLNNASPKTGTLKAMTDTIITNPQNGDVLTFQAPGVTTPQAWINQQPVTPSTPSGTGSATAVSGAATLNKSSGRITSEALASATSYALTLSNSAILAGSTVMVNVTESTGTAVVALLSKVVTAGQLVVHVSMASLTGTLEFDFIVLN